MPKTNSGLQQHTYQEQSILRQTSQSTDATERKLNSALFNKIVEKFGKPGIYFFTTRINKQLDRSQNPENRGNGYQCLLSYLEQQGFLHVSYTFQSCRLNISDDLQRQGKCSNSCNQIVQPILVYLQLLLMTNHNLLYFWLSLRNLTLPHKTSNGKEPMVLIKRSWTKCMSNQNKHSIYNM